MFGPVPFKSPEFTCPDCGGHTWGTSVTNAGSVRHCNGDTCRFEWEPRDDYRYHKIDGQPMTVEQAQEYGYGGR